MEATRLRRTLSSVIGWKDTSQFFNQRGVQQIADLLASVHFPALVKGCMELLQFLIGSLPASIKTSNTTLNRDLQVAVRGRLQVRVFRTEHAYFEYFHPPNQHGKLVLVVVLVLQSEGLWRNRNLVEALVRQGICNLKLNYISVIPRGRTVS